MFDTYISINCYVLHNEVIIILAFQLDSINKINGKVPSEIIVICV